MEERWVFRDGMCRAGLHACAGIDRCVSVVTNVIQVQYNITLVFKATQRNSDQRGVWASLCDDRNDIWVESGVLSLKKKEFE